MLLYTVWLLLVLVSDMVMETDTLFYTVLFLASSGNRDR